MGPVLEPTVMNRCTAASQRMKVAHLSPPSLLMSHCHHVAMSLRLYNSFSSGDSGLKSNGNGPERADGSVAAYSTLRFRLRELG